MPQEFGVVTQLMHQNILSRQSHVVTEVSDVPLTVAGECIGNEHETITTRHAGAQRDDHIAQHAVPRYALGEAELGGDVVAPQRPVTSDDPAEQSSCRDD